METKEKTTAYDMTFGIFNQNGTKENIMKRNCSNCIYYEVKIKYGKSKNTRNKTIPICDIYGNLKNYRVCDDNYKANYQSNYNPLGID